MDIKNNILNILNPLNIYDNDIIDKEISIYSSPLQKLDNLIDQLLNEIFIQTATDYGLHQKKDLLSLIIDDSKPINQKQKQLLYAISTKPDNFNKSGIINSLKALGFDCEIKENYQDESITISFKDKDFKPRNPDLFKDLVLKMLPAHLEVIFDMDIEPTWADLENMSIDPIQELSWTNITH